MLKISVVVVSYNVAHFLELCIDSISKALKKFENEIIVVDNASSDNSCELIESKFPHVRLIKNKDNVGFAKANNQGFAMAQGEYILILNPDTIVPEDFFEKCISFLDAHPNVGSLGPRLIDGKGEYALDSKKSFPSISAISYKMLGLNKLFPKSPKFNSYYAAAVGEFETAEVDILSGCCMFVRKTVLKEVGGGFDEQYFMYCEDFDLCLQIQKHGYKNIYFPQTSIIHYKGESTRKITKRYLQIFFNSLTLFADKYYPKRLAFLYAIGLKMILYTRNVVHIFKYLFSIFKLFLLDILLMLLILSNVRDIYMYEVHKIQKIEGHIAIITTAIYVSVWILSLFFSGAYDKPYSLTKAFKGMFIGTIIVLAGYGLMPVEWRYSRAVILLSGFIGGISLLTIRFILGYFKVIRLVPRGHLAYKGAIVAAPQHYNEILHTTQQLNYGLLITGRIANTNKDKNSIGNLASLSAIQTANQLNEIIFCPQSTSYDEIINSMQRVAPHAYYKIYAPINKCLVGSNSLQHHAEALHIDYRYQIGRKSSQRDKRLLDVLVALTLLITYPIARLGVRNKQTFWKNIWAVLANDKTWVGYHQGLAKELKIPLLKMAVLPPYNIVENYDILHKNKLLLAQNYANNYSVWEDVKILIQNFKFLGKKI